MIGLISIGNRTEASTEEYLTNADKESRAELGKRDWSDEGSLPWVAVSRLVEFYVKGIRE